MADAVAPTPSLLDSLEQLPISYPWRASLLVLANCLAERLCPSAALDPPLPAGASHVLESLRQDQARYTAAWPVHSAAGPADSAAYWSVPLPRTKEAAGLRQLPGAAQLVVLLALAPHLWPGFLDRLVQEMLPDSSELIEFGGVRATHGRGLLPTGDTALFLLGGTDVAARQAMHAAVLGADQPLLRSGLLALATVPTGEPVLSDRLVVEAQALEAFSTGVVTGPRFGPDFPAQRLYTQLEWDDLVLPAATRTLVDDVAHWVQHRAHLRTAWGLGRRLKPGFRALFYGPPGTGKSLTAALLGKHTGCDVYRVDLSLVTSKYIGETEKNLGRLFDRAHAQGWILFFDEADALFGKRTDTRDAHDRFANQEVAYLLQKVEEYDGLVVLASNLKANLDPAFARRFQAMVYFPAPAPAERLILWQQTLPAPDHWADDLHPEDLAARYEVSGAAILNVVQFAMLRALSRNEQTLRLKDITEGIRLEYQKDGELL